MPLHDEMNEEVKASAADLRGRVLDLVYSDFEVRPTQASWVARKVADAYADALTALGF